jgi:hypothetical protein
LQPSDLGSQPKAGEPNFSPSNLLLAGPKEGRGLLVTLYTLVVLMDLGVDPASKEARRMIDRVDKRLVFKPLNNRPFLHGETEPCINGRILAIGGIDPLQPLSHIRDHERHAPLTEQHSEVFNVQVTSTGTEHFFTSPESLQRDSNDPQTGFH